MTTSRVFILGCNQITTEGQLKALFLLTAVEWQGGQNADKYLQKCKYMFSDTTVMSAWQYFLMPLVS